MSSRRKIWAWITVAVVITVAFIFLALPPLLKHFAIQKIDESTGRKSRIERVSLNPFTLTAEIGGVSLSEKGSNATFLSLSSARISLSPLSLPKRSFIVTELRLSSPYLHIVRDAPFHYNFSDLVTPKKEEPQKKKEGTPLFSLNNIVISNGSVDFVDRALSKEKSHRVREMAIAIPFVSNMAYLADRYVTPRFSAVINDSPVKFSGQLKPLTKAVEATVSVKLHNVDLPYYLGYLPVAPPVQIPSGRLSTELEVGYLVDAKTGPELRVSGTTGLERFSVRELNGAPLASLDRADLKIRQAALISRSVDISSLAAEGVELTAARDSAGKWNLQKALASQAASGQRPHPRPSPGGRGETASESKGEAGKGAANTGKESKGRPLDLKLASLSVKGKVHFSDQVPRKGFKSEMQDIALSVRDFSKAQGHKTPVELNFRTARGESVSFKGELMVQPVDFRGHLALNGVPLKDYYPYLAEYLTSPLTGTAALAADLSYSEGGGFVMQKGVITTKALAAPFGEGEGVSIREVALNGLGYDLKHNKATVELFELKGGKVSLSGYPGGTYSYQKLLKTQGKVAGKPQPVRRKTVRAEQGAPAFSMQVRKIAGTDFGVKYTDRTKEEEPSFSLSRLNFTASGLNSAKQGPIPITLAGGYGKSGSLRIAGQVAPQPVGFKGNVALHDIPLRDFADYIPEDVTVFIADGALDTTLSLDLVKKASALEGSFAGSLGVRSFYCQDTVNDEDLLKWERLEMDHLKGTISPFTLAVDSISLSNFYSRVIIQRDGTLNLQHLREETAEAPSKVPATASAPNTPAQAQKAATATAALKAETPKGDEVTIVKTARPVTLPPQEKTPAQGEPRPIRIDAITMQGGTLNFSDRHLETPFDTTFYSLGGRVSGLSSEAGRLADVDLRGNLENHSPLSIKGVMNPLRGDLYLDLKIAVNDIELSPFTPYANTYLGYNVDKGKLSLDLTYKIDKKALSSQNKVFLDQFTFGKSHASDKATKLPVKLAIALLKDRKGEIHLDLPVAGRTDDPKFNVWKVVWQILRNLLVKAATSPLALLGSLTGGGGDDFSAVTFAPGSDRLAKPEQEKLGKLSKALHDRPELKLEITGFVDREADAEGYRNELLSKKMKAEKFRRSVKEGTVKPGQTAEDMEILPQEYPVYLKAVYVKEKFSKPRNMVGMLKDLPDAEMKKLIVTHTVVGENELQALARERTEAVKGYLVAEGKVAPERLFEKKQDIFKPAAKGSTASRVELGAGVK